MEVTRSFLLERYISLRLIFINVNDIRLQKDFDRVLNIYQWGSRVYGCARPDSDWDFVIVTKDDDVLIEPTPRNLLK